MISFKNIGIGVTGAMVYYAAKVSASIANSNKKRSRISSDARKRIQIFFPTLDLSKVWIIENAIIPANWIERESRTEAMTFGWNIYAKRDDLQYQYEGILVLIHELVHVQQMQLVGETNFAARYGKEYIQFGYPNMPLESEAFHFVSNIPFNPQFYLKLYKDVNPVTGDLSSGAFAHWLDVGIDEGRDSTEYFNASRYMRNHSDLTDMLGAKKYKAGVLHWIQYGKDQGRKGN